MARRRLHTPLRVLLNNEEVGRLAREAGGAIEFRYAEGWLAREAAAPVSLSLPLREDAYRGGPVSAVFDNLLPDSEALKRRVAERVGAEGTDAYSLLAKVGRDCVGALQFVPADDDTVYDTSRLEGEPVGEAEIETILKNLAQSPLGLDRGDEFRISVAGAQEKTALLWHRKRWLKPHGATPTTHLLKKQIGTLPNGIDLSHSVENEYYCLRLLAAFGLPVNHAEMQVFGRTRVLVVERFDRRWTKDGRLLRVAQEDCCQALSVPPGMKYQSEGGPGMVDILRLLQGSDTPAEDQKRFLKAQMLAWLLGATDGHAKNFSVFLGPGGRFKMTPLYDVLSAQPSLAARHIQRQKMKLAMFVGDRRHYRVDEIRARHFLQTAKRAALPLAMAEEALEEIRAGAEQALAQVEEALPPRFPKALHAAVAAGVRARLALG